MVVSRRSEAPLHSCFYKKVFWKYAANLQENTHVKVWFLVELTAYFQSIFSYEQSGGLLLNIVVAVDDDDDVDYKLFLRSGWPTESVNLISSWDQCQRFSAV